MLHALRKVHPLVCTAVHARWRTVLACGDVSSGALGDGPHRLDAAPAYEPQVREPHSTCHTVGRHALSRVRGRGETSMPCGFGLRVQL